MSLVDDIKAQVCISELASRYTEVRRRGRLHVCRCLCGQNSDRNPSFTLYDEDNHFHCYACGRHGSVIDLVMLTEGVDFKAAVDRLRSGLNGRGESSITPVFRPKPAMRVHAITPEVQAILEAATTHYQVSLQRNAKAQDYLRKRGLNNDTIAKMRIGFAGGDLGRALFDGKHDLALAAQIGLLLPRGELMRGRIVFPVLDEQSRPVWMLGRALDDATQPKYLGLPDGIVHKQPMVIGKLVNGVIWVEGPFDLAALVQWGFDANYLIVGLLGTAYADALVVVRVCAPGCTIFVATDQDAAGELAAEAILRDLAAQGVSGVRVRWVGAKDCGGLAQRECSAGSRFWVALENTSLAQS